MVTLILALGAGVCLLMAIYGVGIGLIMLVGGLDQSGGQYIGVGILFAFVGASLGIAARGLASRRRRARDAGGVPLDD